MLRCSNAKLLDDFFFSCLNICNGWLEPLFFNLNVNIYTKISYNNWKRYHQHRIWALANYQFSNGLLLIANTLLSKHRRNKLASQSFIFKCFSFIIRTAKWIVISKGFKAYVNSAKTPEGCISFRALRGARSKAISFLKKVRIDHLRHRCSVSWQFVVNLSVHAVLPSVLPSTVSFAFPLKYPSSVDSSDL